jgi:hypothetical protein
MHYELKLNSGNEQSWQQLWISWVVITLIGTVLGLLIASLLDTTLHHLFFTWTLREPDRAIAHEAVALYSYSIVRFYFVASIYSAISSYIQWHYVLKPHGIAPSRWVVMSIAGVVAGLAITDAAQFITGIERTELIWSLISSLIRGVVLGLILWQVLNPYSTSAKWLLPAYASAIVLAIVVSNGVAQLASPMIQQASSSLFSEDIQADPYMLKTLFTTYAVFVPISLVNGLIYGLITSVITGPVIATIIETVQDSKTLDSAQ